MQSPRASQKFSTKQDDYEKRPASAGISNEVRFFYVEIIIDYDFEFLVCFKTCTSSTTWTYTPN